MCWKTLSYSEMEGFPEGMARCLWLTCQWILCDLRQKFLKNIFWQFYCFKQSNKLKKSSKAQVLSTCNWWESHHMYFPYVNNRREYILEMNDYHDTHQPWKNAKNDIMALINICTLTWVRSGMSPWSIPTCWVYKKRKKNNKYALLHAVAGKTNSEVWMLHRN